MDTTSVNDCCDGLENSVTSPANAFLTGVFIRRVSITISFKIVVSLVTIDLLNLQTRSSYWLKLFCPVVTGYDSPLPIVSLPIFAALRLCVLRL
ncbi:hypothetical protein A2U01_0040638, partial [Trifolium medium]|nr:hypothetical protein [Trifolium medium]